MTDKEQILLLRNGKCIRKLRPDHALFEHGNALRSNKYYKESYPDEEEGLLYIPKKQQILFQCHLFNCKLGFESISSYEEHYELLHRNICRECCRSFLSMRLLDIHMSETHDAFFCVLSKKKPSYVCLVEGCTEVFKADDKRHKHLIQVHHYPKSFSFHRKRKKKTEQKQKKIPKKPQQSELSNSTQEQMEICETKEETSKKDDVNMEEIEERLKNIKIPSKLSFGRRGRRRW